MADTLEQRAAGPTPPAESGLAAWFATMKQVFLGLVDGGASPAAASDNGAARVATLRHTFDNVRLQAPEIAIRPMQDIAGELTALAFGLGHDDGKFAGDAGAFQSQVEEELGGLKAQAASVAAGHVAGWNAGITNLPEAGPAASPEGKKARALGIQTLLAEIEAGVARDSYMLRQVGGDARALDAIQRAAAVLKSDYAKLIPKRTTEGDPTRLDDVARPTIKGTLNATELETLNKAMKDTQALMGSDRQPDAAVVRNAVALIEKGIDVESARASLARLGTWVAVKEEYRALVKAKSPGAAGFMAKMWWYRRMRVDGEMTKLQEQYDFIWGSVGSDNPESDYDLTVRTHPNKKVKGSVEWDYQIVELANAAITTGFGTVPPGILFDTNLYAEAAAAPQEFSDEQKRDPAIMAMGAMKEQGQDVGALMKLRRFMEWDEYEDYKAGMLKGIADPKDRALVARQFEEADSLFFIARAEQLQKAAELIPDEGQSAAALKKIAAIPMTPRGQKELADMAEHLEHHDPARSMAANNAIYVEKLTEVRKLEDQYNKAIDAKDKAGLLARLKSYQADATFFAAEAYHSEGPLQHVVKAGQSSKLEIQGNGVTYATNAEKDAAIEERKQEKLKALSPNQMLQSFNENLGDLLKDLRHYAAEPFPGLGFYRSSKYIERLCDAVAVLGPKLPSDAQGGFAELTLGGKTPAEVRTAVGGLVEIRGEKKGFPQRDGKPEDPEAEKQAYAIAEMSEIFPGVVTLPDLAKVVNSFGQQVNTLVRSAITKDMRALDQNPYFPR